MDDIHFGRRLKTVLACAFLVAAIGAAPAANGQESSDVVIRGGAIFDGTSTAPVVGDVAIAGDKIVYVGPTAANPYRAKRIIDARGKIVAPGFIDPHTHAEEFLTGTDTAKRLNLPWLMQGVTTVFAGVDGYGQPDGRNEVGAFLDAVDRNPVGTNVAAYVGFGAVRQSVLGESDQAPAPAQLERMKAMVANGMCEGALGLSAGLFYAPQSFANREEVIALAREAGRRGGVYDTHQRDESSYGIGLMGSIAEAIEIGRAAGIPVHFAHLKALGVDVHGMAPQIVAAIDAARKAGLDVTADQYPWEASGSALEPALLPRWALADGREAMLARFDDAAALARIKTEMRENLRRRGGAQSVLLTEPGQPWTARRLAEMAEAWQTDAIDAALRIIRQSANGSPVVSFNMVEADIELLMKQPWVMTGSDGSDGHPRMYATYPQKYAKYVLDRKTIDLATFINGSTSRAADSFGLDRRGRLRAGHFADILVFDPDSYRPRADYVHPAVLSEGVDTLLVNGAVTVSDGKPTGIAAGRGLKQVPPAGTCAS
ncbi:N-acyl-D-amino-acid deacylase family protein [Sphingosinicella rhizophila]|uniref:Amidohydrolase family protein n=1 Tax=Sphingosinicella rhizophila TaxID=3050082 RepID=A0ABU3QAR6_9SPHN|nr:amidohydrolase family protein [Sphingosinicella sp. GR2756]MDT9600488.1 amidohydrolase family protein [Sphingosinicella sp. GR2756]